MDTVFQYPGIQSCHYDVSVIHVMYRAMVWMCTLGLVELGIPEEFVCLDA